LADGINEVSRLIAPQNSSLALKLLNLLLHRLPPKIVHNRVGLDKHQYHA